MAYKFTFDLSKLPKNLIKEITEISLKKGVHLKINTLARKIVKTLNLEKISGIPFNQIITVVEDILEIQKANIENRKKFVSAKKRALLLPHCSRKYMDSRCKAEFDGISYTCKACSKDCLVRRAKTLAEKKGYEVFVLPGGSCIPKILSKGYDGVIGIACPNEIKLAGKYLKEMGVSYQSIPLLKNGCSKTKFKISMLHEVL